MTWRFASGIRFPAVSLFTGILLAAAPATQAGQRFVIEARFEMGEPSGDDGHVDFIARSSTGDRRQIAFVDPAGRLQTRLPARMTVTGELKRFLPGDIPLLEVLHVAASSWQGLPGGLTPATNPALFAGFDNGLYPSAPEPIPRVITSLDVGPGTPGTVTEMTYLMSTPA